MIIRPAATTGSTGLAVADDDGALAAVHDAVDEVRRLGSRLRHRDRRDLVRRRDHPVLHLEYAAPDRDIALHKLPRRLRRRALVAGLLAEHTGRSSERVGADLDRPTVLDAPAAVEYGLVDHVVTSRRDAVG